MVLRSTMRIPAPALCLLCSYASAGLLGLVRQHGLQVYCYALPVGLSSLRHTASSIKPSGSSQNAA